MAEQQRISGIDINEDMNYQWREWRVQRIAWIVIALLLLAALLGLLGSGPLSNGQAGEQNGPLYVEYQRIDRYEASGELKITAGPNTAKGGDLRLTLNQDYVDRVQINDVQPEPDSVEADGDKLVYVFKVADAGQPSNIRFDYQFSKVGTTPVQVGIEQGPEVSFSQFVLP